MADNGKALPGVVAIYTSKEGAVIASVSDFDRSGYGGFSLLEGQTMRAKRALSHAVIHAYCSEVLSRVMETYDCERLLDRMVRDGAHITIVPVGQKDEP